MKKITLLMTLFCFGYFNETQASVKTGAQLDKEYSELCGIWRVAKTPDFKLSLIPKFITLGKDSAKAFFKAKCTYNAGVIAREVNNTELSNQYLNQIRVLAKPVSGKDFLNLEDSVLYGYSALAIVALRDNATTDIHTRIGLAKELSSEYQDSVVAAQFIGKVNDELWSGRIAFDEWTTTVLVSLENRTSIPKRFSTDIEMGIRSAKEASDSAKLAVTARALSLINARAETPGVYHQELEKLKSELEATD